MIKLNIDGSLTITKEVSVSPTTLRGILRLTVAGDGEFTSDWIHSRWSTLYNAYDVVYGGDVRARYKEYKENTQKVSRVEYICQTGQLNNLVILASKLYPDEFQSYAEDELNGQGLIKKLLTV